MIRYGSLFAGAGLLDYGLHRAIPSLDCAFAVEVNDARRAIFGAHFPDARLLGDIESVRASDIPQIDGLIGGVPCNTHSTSNTAGDRGLAPEWEHAKRLTRDLRPRWTLWESSAKDRSWRRWVPFVRRDLWDLGHASVPFRLRTAPRGAPHDRDRAFVVSWQEAADRDGEGQPPRAVHAALASLRAAPADLWDGWVPPRAHGRLAHGSPVELARAVGLGVDQRTAADAARVLGALIRSLTSRTQQGSGAPARW
jgi:DNA (cytosine-5)-methyltransferase 1